MDENNFDSDYWIIRSMLESRSAADVAPPAQKHDVMRTNCTDSSITFGELRLREVIDEALARCFRGKGKERHNVDGSCDFMNQPLMEISRRTGVGGPLYQVHKKAYEAHDMLRGGDKERAINELLDIIVYTSATILLLKEKTIGD